MYYYEFKLTIHSIKKNGTYIKDQLFHPVRNKRLFTCSNNANNVVNTLSDGNHVGFVKRGKPHTLKRLSDKFLTKI